VTPSRPRKDSWVSEVSRCRPSTMLCVL
jgi:hypothetical protein